MLKRARHGSRGIALMVVMELLMVVFVISIAFLVNNDNNLIVLGQEKQGTQAFYVADSAAQQALRDLDDRITSISAPGIGFSLLDRLYNNTTLSDSITYVDPTSLATETAGSYNLSMSIYPASGSAPYTVTGSTTSPVPRATDPTPPTGFLQYKVITFQVSAVSGAVSRKVTVKAMAGLRVSGEVNDPFNFSYFMNDFGWFEGSTSLFSMNGNVGANGDFTVMQDPNVPFNGPMTVNGDPYVGPNGTVVDKATVYASGTINAGTNNEMIAGNDVALENNATRKNLPNLNNLDYYKQLAQSKGGTITQNGTTLVNGVFTGSAPSQQNIVLDGTTNPISINGPVVVDGNVVVKGTITGQGTLYVGQNLYVAGDVTYGSGTAPPTPPSYDPNTMTEQQYVDALAQYRKTYESSQYSQVTYAVRKNVVYGDVTAKPGNNTYDPQSYQADWWGTVSQSMGLTVNGEHINDGHEDAGLDKIWTTNDAKENDGSWTVSVLDPSSGHNLMKDFSVSNGAVQVPDGTTILPGSGEDAVGDGQYHGAFQYGDFAGGVMDTAGNSLFNATNYANFPSGASSFPYPADHGGYGAYSDSVNRVDGFVVSNGGIAGINGDWRGKYTVSGTYTDSTSGTTVAYTASKPTDIVNNGGEVGRVDLMLSTGAGYPSDLPIPSLAGQQYRNIWYHDPRFGDSASPLNATMPVVAALALGSWDEPDVAK